MASPRLLPLLMLLLLLCAIVSVNCRRREFGRKVSLTPLTDESATPPPPGSNNRRAGRPGSQRTRVPVRKFGAGRISSQGATSKPASSAGGTRRRGRGPVVPKLSPLQVTNVRGRPKLSSSSIPRSRGRQTQSKPTGVRRLTKPVTTLSGRRKPAAQSQRGQTAGQFQRGQTAGQSRRGQTAGQFQRGQTAGQSRRGKTVGQSRRGKTAGRNTARGSPSQSQRTSVQRPGSITLKGTRTQKWQRPNIVDYKCPEVNGTFAHEEQCDKYYWCLNGEASEELCQDGLIFHPDRVYPCVYPAEGDCPTNRKQEAVSTEECPRQFATFKDASDLQDCGSFTKCVAGTVYPSRCPEGLAFNSATLGCGWPDLVEECTDVAGYLGYECEQREFTAQEAGDFTMESHPSNCTMFYLCVNSPRGVVLPRLQSCPDSTVFDGNAKQCTDNVEEVEGCADAVNTEVLAARRQRQQEEKDRRESRLAELKAKFFS